MTDPKFHDCDFVFDSIIQKEDGKQKELRKCWICGKQQEIDLDDSDIWP